MRITFFLLLPVLTLLQAQSGPNQPFGHFVGTVQVEWLDDGRKMQLLADYAYIDQNGKTWSAPKGSEVDGASTPRVFWSFIGGPYEGKYRNASVVHDVACDKKLEDWRAVHRMFYNACRCGGVEQLQAKIMYGAVYHFGPRWGSLVNIRALSSDVDFKRMKAHIEQSPEIELSGIESLSGEQLAREFPQITATD